jgi:hypothetical protein
MTCEERVFDGKQLRATLWGRGAEKLFVTFQFRRPDPGSFPQARSKESVIALGWAHLSIQSRQNDWFICDETQALEAALAALAPAFQIRAGLGFSMGGYGAFRFARCLGLHRVLAVSPQYSIAPAHVPFDTRFRADANTFCPNLGDLAPRAMALDAIILVDPFQWHDLANARMIADTFPGSMLVRLPGGGHPASQILREAGQFGALQACLTGATLDARPLQFAHRRMRGQNPRYWEGMATCATRLRHRSFQDMARAQLRACQNP